MLNSRACALETTASFLALPVPCVPGPREDARGRGNEDGFEVAFQLHSTDPGIDRKALSPPQRRSFTILQ